MGNAAGHRMHAVAVGAFLVLLATFACTGAWPLLDGLGVPTMEQPFADARAIAGASVALERGLDPMLQNPGDPWGRPLNYPRVWHLLAQIGVGPQHAELLAALFVLLFVVGLAAANPLVRSAHAARVFALALFGPATWLAIERGNSDLAMFGLCAGAVWLLARFPRLGAALIGLAAALKLYPIAALVACVGERARASLRIALPVAALFGAYAWLTRSDLAAIRAGTQHVPRIAYGIAIGPELVAKNTGLPLRGLLLAAAGALLALAGLGCAVRLRTRLGAEGPTATLAAFRAGAAVFLASFCIGTSFDYRLVFLLLALPQLAAWSEAGAGGLRRGARATVAAALLMLWSLTWRQGVAAITGLPGVGLILHEVVSWALWGLLAVLLILTMPDWLVPAPRRGRPFADAK